MAGRPTSAQPFGSGHLAGVLGEKAGDIPEGDLLPRQICAGEIDDERVAADDQAALWVAGRIFGLGVERIAVGVGQVVDKLAVLPVDAAIDPGGHVDVVIVDVAGGRGWVCGADIVQSTC